MQVYPGTHMQRLEKNVGCLPLLHSTTGPSDRIRHCSVLLGGLQALVTCLSLFSNAGVQAHRATFDFLHEGLGFKLRSLGLKTKSYYPLSQNNSSPLLLALCSDPSVPKLTTACMCRSEDNLASTVWILGVGFKFLDLAASAFTRCHLNSPRISFVNTF